MHSKIEVVEYQRLRVVLWKNSAIPGYFCKSNPLNYHTAKVQCEVK